jgi:replicative DNA helicase
MKKSTSNARDVISLINSNDIEETMPELFAPITKGSLPEMETIDTLEESLKNGEEEHQKAILATYDKIGRFDLKKLEVKVLDSGFNILNKHRVLTKDQGRLITIGAHTSHGKSALLMQLAAHVSKTEPVIVHSFEMSSEEIETRLLAAVAEIPTELIVDGSAHAKKIEAAREDFKNRKLYVSNIQNRSLNFVTSSIYELSKAIGKPGLIVIDYGQQVKPGGSGLRETQRVVEITDISAGLLQLAQQLKCNVLVGAQLNNEVLKRAYSTKDEDGYMEYIPIISDIREGSSIAHDSSLVLMLVRPYVFDRMSPKDYAHFYCLKHRGGELWDADVKWNGSKCMFYEDSGI